MDYKIDKLEKNQLKITISLNKDEWQSEIETAYKKNKDKYNVVGFRKGKAPRKVIEKTYGNNVFYEEALSDSFYKYYFDVLKNQPEIQPIDNPSLKILEISDDKLVVEAKVINQPEVVLKKYKNFGVKVEPKKASEKDVEVELKKFLEQNVRLVESDKPAKNKNIVNIDFTGSINGKEFNGGKSKGYDLELGSRSFIDNFEEQLIGLKAGDEKDVNVNFPENYHIAELTGKPAVFNVKINSVKIKEYPQLNDDLIKNVTEFESLDEFKKSIEKELQKNFDAQAKLELENKIIEKVLSNMEVEIPSVMIDSELEHYFEDFETRLLYQGLTLEQYAKYMNTTVKGLKEQKRSEAEKNVKVRLALQYIMAKENINLTDKDVEDKIKNMANSAKKSVEEFKQLIDEHRLSHIKNDILMDKLFKFLTANN